MKIGFAQFAPVFGHPLKNAELIESMAPDFQSADLIVLPELCSSGYNFSSREEALALSEVLPQSPFLERLHSLCTQHNLYLVAGVNERDGDLLYNSAVLMGPGGILGKYRKMHLFWNEKDIFEPGNLGFPVFQIENLTLGILICFDWIFPEAWRILALKKADIICHPSNLVLPGLAQRAVPIRAVENRFFVVMANRTGDEGDLHFTGCSTIAGPAGNVLAQASEGATEVKIVEADISLARDKQITPRNSVILDRRPADYDLICKS
ncbi:MAG: carbon-nitrogen hydrolase [FCB group bacterium]|nr:carbon-nitrogen hydrolase [FCB group bacterium]